MSSTLGPAPGATAVTVRIRSSGTATSPATRLRICRAQDSQVCSSRSSRPSERDSLIISASSTIETVFSSSVFGSTPIARTTVRAPVVRRR